MPISLNLYRMSELIPKHNQEIVYFRESKFYGSFEPQEATAEYSWFEYDKDEDGEYPTGNQICYEEDQEEMEGCRLEILVDNGECMQEGVHFWMPADEFHNAFGGEDDEQSQQGENI